MILPYIHSDKTEGSTTFATSILLQSLSHHQAADNKVLSVTFIEFFAIKLVSEVGLATEYSVVIWSFIVEILSRNTKY
jgi:hypothetical protein